MRIPHPVRAACLAALALACATAPPESQRFLTLETTHFAIVSSLGPEQTRALAVDLERFHAGVVFALGLHAPKDAKTLRTRVYAFDDRSFARPFEVHGDPGYFLDTVAEPVLVLRTGGGFREDATLELRHLYAHQVFRSLWPGRAPLWYEEGLCQLASTLELRGDSILVGLPRADHLAALRDWSVHSVAPVIEAQERIDRSPRDREEFAAESWILAHYLRLGPGAAQKRPLLRYARLLDGGADSRTAARSAFGTEDEELASALNDYVRGRSLPGLTVDAQSLGDPQASAPKELSRAASRVALGELALALGRAETGEDLFRGALAKQPEDARANSGVAVAARLQGRWQEALLLHERALAAAPEDPRILRDLAATRITQAAAESGEAREHYVELARDPLEHSLALDPASAEAHAMWAETSLLLGRDLDGGLEHAAAARAVRPASLELELLEARVRAKRGEIGAARDAAIDVASRTHDSETAAQALAFLAELPPSG